MCLWCCFKQLEQTPKTFINECLWTKRVYCARMLHIPCVKLLCRLCAAAAAGGRLESCCGKSSPSEGLRTPESLWRSSSSCWRRDIAWRNPLPARRICEFLHRQRNVEHGPNLQEGPNKWRTSQRQSFTKIIKCLQLSNSLNCMFCKGSL